MDLPVLVPLSQLDKREDQLNGEIDWAQLVIMKKIAREYIKTHLKVQFAGERMNSNMKKPEEVEQSEPKNGIQKKVLYVAKKLLSFLLTIKCQQRHFNHFLLIKKTSIAGIKKWGRNL